MSDRKRTAALLVFYVLSTCLVDSDLDRERNLSRRKRYVVFPEGSSFSIALCMTVHTLTSDNIFTEGLNWGISYDLPNESKPALEPFLELRKDAPSKYHYHDKPDYPVKPAGWNHDKKLWGEKFYSPKVKKNYYKTDYDYSKRRHRRDLYNKLEIIMNAMNFDGRACVLRALCEASQRLVPKGNTLVEEMIRIAFTLPMSRVLSHEPEDHRTYANAHSAGYVQGQDCSKMYAGCSFSLIDMALGKYNSEPERKYYEGSLSRLHRGYSVDTSREDRQEVRTLEDDDVTSGETSRSMRYNMK